MENKLAAMLDSCFVPKSYGVIYKELKETNLWEVYCKNETESTTEKFHNIS